jgi:hypothetical protein
MVMIASPQIQHEFGPRIATSAAFVWYDGGAAATSETLAVRVRRMAPQQIIADFVDKAGEARYGG